MYTSFVPRQPRSKLQGPASGGEYGSTALILVYSYCDRTVSQYYKPFCHFRKHIDQKRANASHFQKLEARRQPSSILYVHKVHSAELSLHACTRPIEARKRVDRTSEVCARLDRYTTTIMSRTYFLCNLALSRRTWQPPTTEHVVYARTSHGMASPRIASPRRPLP